MLGFSESWLQTFVNRYYAAVAYQVQVTTLNSTVQYDHPTYIFPAIWGGVFGLRIVMNRLL